MGFGDTRHRLCDLPFCDCRMPGAGQGLLLQASRQCRCAERVASTPITLRRTDAGAPNPERLLPSVLCPSGLTQTGSQSARGCCLVLHGCVHAPRQCPMSLGLEGVWELRLRQRRCAGWPQKAEGAPVAGEAGEVGRGRGNHSLSGAASQVSQVGQRMQSTGRRPPRTDPQSLPVSISLSSVSLHVHSSLPLLHKQVTL